MNWIDLHIHSNASMDSQHTPETLISMCAEKGVRVAVISDHNSVKNVKKGLELGEKAGIEMIPAVELDCSHTGVELHILGYGIDYTQPVFAEINEKWDKLEFETSIKRAELIRALGIQFDWDKVLELANGKPPTAEKIAQVALADPRNDALELLRPYRKGGAKGESPYSGFWWDICAQGKPAYIKLEMMPAQRAIDIIHSAGGIAVLAHPGANLGMNDTVVRALARLGLDGIEVFSSYHDSTKTAFYKDTARELGLIMTLGSDYHGDTKPNIEIGEVFCDEPLDDIYAWFKEKLTERKG